jgi:metal-responsive CopG/Arc/MetJ family transcriptional regulator
MQRNVPIGISLPEDVVSTIDTKRGDVSRSKYLLRILQKTYDSTRPNNMSDKHCYLERNESQNLLDHNGTGTPNDQANPSVHKRGNPLP